MHDVAGPWGVRVLAEQCATCIFRPGNPMHLQRGRVAEMVRECVEREGHVVCHDTLDAPSAICRGWFDHPAAVPLPGDPVRTRHRDLRVRSAAVKPYRPVTFNRVLRMVSIEAIIVGLILLAVAVRTVTMR